MNESIIEQLLAPVVLISACGLLIMALNARLMAVIARIRFFHQERFERFLKLSDSNETNKIVKLRFEGLEFQTHCMLKRATQIKYALMLLVFSIICMLMSSLVIGASTQIPMLESFALGLFIFGLISMLAGMLIALLEIAHSLDQVEYEHSRMGEVLTNEHDGN